MNKISLIISREFFTRVRKRSFIVMSILGPLIFAAFLILPAWFANLEDKEEKLIAVVDSSHLFIDRLDETNYIKFDYRNDIDPVAFKDFFFNSGYYAILFISPSVATYTRSIKLFSDQSISLGVELHVENSIEKELERLKMEQFGIDDNILSSIRSDLKLEVIKISKKGDEQKGVKGIARITGYIGGFLIYFFIFFFGAQIMRGVLEEKTNRIVEVIISSVKPFQLMMGKIIGVGLVGLTQFFIWLALTLMITTAIQTAFFPELSKKTKSSDQVIEQDFFSSESVPVQHMENKMENPDLEEIKSVLSAFESINFLFMLGVFLFYFLAGYLLYAAMFAAIGAAVDNETDTQQFMLPITIPLIFSIFVMINAIQNPGSQLSVWCSIIPFTSPIVMLARIPFGVRDWELILSVVLLIATFIFMTWIAAKIYRTGILLYGKKPTYKELWKWLRYKN
ncbi:ABC transporter permease [Bacteroidota bacterium]